MPGNSCENSEATFDIEFEVGHCAVIPLYFKIAGVFGGGSENDNRKNISPPINVANNYYRNPGDPKFIKITS